MEGFFKIARQVFMLSYIVSGALWAYYASRFVWDLKSPMAYLGIAYLVVLPLLLAGVGVFKLFKHASSEVYLWIASVYWFFITFGEVIEGDGHTPTITILMLIVCLTCVVFLLIQKRKQRQTETRPLTP